MFTAQKKLFLILLVILTAVSSIGFLVLRGRSQSSAALVAPVFRTPAITQPSPLPGVRVPEAILRCVGETGKYFDLLGTVSEKQKTFYLLGVYDAVAGENPLFARDVLIAQGGKLGCLRLISPDIPKPLRVFISIDAARELELQRYRHIQAQLGGKQQLERALKDQLGNYYLSDEQVWALEKLKVEFPKNYELLSPDTFGGDEETFRKDLLEKY